MYNNWFVNPKVTQLGSEIKRNATVTEVDNLPGVPDSLVGIPGMPLLLASVCIVFAIIAAYFVKDIKNGTVRDKTTSDESAEEGPTSNSQSESDSQTKVNIKSSVSDVKEFVDAEKVKSNLRECWIWKAIIWSIYNNM